MNYSGIDREDCTQNNMMISGHEIATWYSEGIENPYQAVNMSVAREALKDYGLTEEEHNSIPALMAGYCRLLDEYGLTGYGETELLAIVDLFSHATRTD